MTIWHSFVKKVKHTSRTSWGQKIGDRPRFFLRKDMSIFTTQKYYEDQEKLVEKSWSVPHFPKGWWQRPMTREKPRSKFNSTLGGLWGKFRRFTAG